jgi:tetraacyldisaccharide 4'-kinase
LYFCRLIALQINALKLFFTFLLWPFSVVWDGITRLRNYLYDTGLKPSVTFSVPVIAVGNLSVGGTGKTPMTEYLIRLLQPYVQVGVLSRGYRRKTRGLYFAGPDATASRMGDEPMQLAAKFPEAAIAVCEDRVYAIPHMLQRYPNVGVVVLDDAFQHRRLKAGCYLLLTDYARPFYRDYLLPAGTLRESRKGACRAHAVVVTKCPAHLDEAEMNHIVRAIRTYTNAPVFFTGLQYGHPLPVHQNCPALSQKVVLVTGIARPHPFVAWAKNHFTVLHHFNYPDHHAYSRSDVEKMQKFIHRYAEPVSILTTEKDAIKLAALAHAAALPVFSVPVYVTFLKDGKVFDNLVMNYALGLQV